MTRVSETGDPRLEALFGTPEAREVGVRPMVRLPRSWASPWLIGAGVLLAALLLFWVLESRRGAQPQASVRERAPDLRGYAAEPPPLYIPPAPPPVQLAPQTAVDPSALPEQRPLARVFAPPEAAPAYYPPQPAPPSIAEPAPVPRWLSTRPPELRPKDRPPQRHLDQPLEPAQSVACARAALPIARRPSRRVC